MATIGFETPVAEKPCGDVHPDRPPCGYAHHVPTGEGILTCDQHELRDAGPREEVRPRYLEHLVGHMGELIQDLQQRLAVVQTNPNPSFAGPKEEVLAERGRSHG